MFFEKNFRNFKKIFLLSEKTAKITSYVNVTGPSFNKYFSERIFDCILFEFFEHFKFFSLSCKIDNGNILKPTTNIEIKPNKFMDLGDLTIREVVESYK